MAEIRCPMCGKSNPAGAEICRSCRARLAPLTGGASSDEPASSTPPESDADWLAGIRTPAGQDELPAGQESDWWASEEIPAAEEVPDWLSAIGGPEDGVTPGAANLPADEPDWLQRIRSRQQDEHAPGGDTGAGEGGPSGELNPEPGLADFSTDYDRFIQEQKAHLEQGQAAEDLSSSADLRAWLAGLDHAAAPEPPEEAEAQPAAEASSDSSALPAGQPEEDWLAGVPGLAANPAAELPDWLEADRAPEGQPAAAEQPVAEEQPATWEQPVAEEQPVDVLQPDVTDQAAAELPAFDPGAGEQVEEPPVENTAAEPFAALPEQPEEALDLDWLAAGASIAVGLADGQETEGGARAFAAADSEPADEPAEEEGFPELAAAELPEWLSRAAAPGEAGERGEPPSPPDQPQSLPQAELPGWLESIRPLPGISPETPATDENRPESAGPLSGLRGLLPAEPLISLVQKPPVYLNKLQISEAQQANANLLAGLIEAEGVQPAARQRKNRSAIYLLRVFAALVLSGVVLWSILSGGLVSPLPVFSDGTNLARGLIEALPQASPVLLVSDYQPGTAAELEAAAAPVIDHLLLKGAHLALVSTTPTGALQSERLVAAGAASGNHRVQSGEQTTQLGFLPGGPLGISAFAADPAQALPLDEQGNYAWLQGPLANLRSVQDFGLIVVAADDSEAARAWIEQLALARGETPLLVVSSAQAAPQLRPYLQQVSGINGLVTGISGGAAYEAWQNRSGLASRSWSTFSLALVVTAGLILVGGLLQAVAGQWSARQPTARGGEKS